ncbi:MAG: hypothetical protein R2795_15140 [Saprospiraceae bacterium]
MVVQEPALQINGRRVMIASYVPEAVQRVPMREDFPPEDMDYMGGKSDGAVYRSVFAGRTLDDTYNMVRSFLLEEGYHHLPLPTDAAELLHFRLPVRNKQLLLFEDNGYVHFPIKILFPLDGRKRNSLELLVYNENLPGQLLRFHNKL